MPITSIQIDLFVGEPVKNLETSEEKDCDALTPKIINATPAASSASPRTLFMCFISVFFVGVDSSATAQGPIRAFNVPADEHD
jgi:hypothetical protein